MKFVFLIPLFLLPMLDAVARNVAIRQASPDSDWLLSTTTDAVLVREMVGAKNAPIRWSVMGLPDE